MPVKISSSLFASSKSFVLTSPKYMNLIAACNDSEGIVLGSFHVVVSGAAASLFAKYGERAARMSLWRANCSVPVVRVISDVLGCSFVSRELMCAAKGCRGSVDFE
jgi:hypothetical protein